MRIFHGISSVSLQSTRYLVDAMRTMGHTADSVVYRNEGPLFDLEDVNLHMDFRKKYLYPMYSVKVMRTFLSAIRNYDVFHFHFGHSFLPHNMDMGILRKLGKKVFMEYHGTEIRYILNRVGKDRMEQYIDEERKERSFRLQKRVAKYANGIIVHDAELTRNLIPSKVPLYIVPLRLDVTKFCNTGDTIGSGPVVILHAPSHRGKKGTEYVLAAVEKLKEKYNFQFSLVENMSYDKSMELYKTADIVIDQLMVGSYGMLAIESMAQGKTVLCYVEDEASLFGDTALPLCNANAFNLCDKLSELLADPSLRRKYASAAMKYVIERHDSVKCAKQLLEIYSGSELPSE